MLITKFSIWLSNFLWISMIFATFWARWRHQNGHRYVWNLAVLLRNHETIFAFHSISRWNWRPLKTRTSAMHTVNTVRCHYNAVNFLANVHKRHPIARPLSYRYSASVPVIIYAVSYYIGPRYNSIRLYYDYLHQKPSGSRVNTLRPWRNVCHFTDDSSQQMFFFRKQMYRFHLRFHWSMSTRIEFRSKIPALVQIMAWCRPSDKSLSGPIMVYLTDAYLRHSVSMS